MSYTWGIPISSLTEDRPSYMEQSHASQFSAHPSADEPDSWDPDSTFRCTYNSKRIDFPFSVVMCADA